jgi:(p)ppGpp synthase/HD superfamily hydrolase
MDVLLLNELLNYNPNTQLTPDDFIKEIYHAAEQYLSNDDVDKIKIAYEFAKKAHEGVFRSS